MHCPTHVGLLKAIVTCRLWQAQLQQSYPIWADAGVTPKPGSTWKQLVGAVSKVERPGAPDISLDLKPWQCPVADYRMLWNSGGPLCDWLSHAILEDHVGWCCCWQSFQCGPL